MKVGCIADIHGNFSALAAVMKVLRDHVDTILFMGDLCGYYPFLDECVGLLRQSPLIGVRGNHDQVLLGCIENGVPPDEDYRSQYGSALGRSIETLSAESVSFLRALPESLTVTLAGVVTSLFHGAPWDPFEGRVYPDFEEWERFDSVSSDIVLLGQTHYPMEKHLGSKVIVNPGSVGQPRDRSGAACFAVIDLASGAVEQHRVAFDHRPLVEDARKNDPRLPYLVEVLTRI